MSLQAGDFRLWDFSQVSSLANSLSVSRCGEKQEAVSGNPVKDDIASGDFESKIPSTALGDFTNIWKQLKSEVALQHVGDSGCAGSISHHQEEDLLNPNLKADNFSKLDEDLKGCFRGAKQGISHPSYDHDHVAGIQQPALQPCRPQRSATCSGQAEAGKTTTTESFDKIVSKRSTQETGMKINRQRVNSKLNAAEHLPQRNSPVEPIGKIDARLKLASRDSGLQFSNNMGIVMATIKPDVLRKSLPEKPVPFVHSDSEISLQRTKGSASKAAAFSKRSSLYDRSKTSFNGKPITRQSQKRVQVAENPSSLVQQAESWDKGGQLPLLFKLIQDFSEERKWLVKPLQLADHTSSPNGIHVFVDFSNLSIGFNNYMKMIDGIPLDIRTRFKNLSFEALVLLMERQRPVSKRVLAGSLPFVPAFGMAKAIGYELNVLDKVFKAKEVKTPTRGKINKSTRLANSSYPSSGSETTGNSAYTTEKWVEQGVDEILHLKILESVVDVEIPTTMVLGTGDGAVAEYSQGFYAMVERALRKGWNVELVSWSHNIGHAYKKRSFRNQWSQQFKIIELDGYAMELRDS